jgi:amino-acid N-acetyltransferase
MASKIEKALISDATQIHKLINMYAEQGQMLARPLSEIYENIRDFFVVRDDGRLLACAALHIAWADLAEVKSLAVNEGFRHQGLAGQLVSACLAEAAELGIATVFCLTYVTPFFQKCGFNEVDKATLPHKIWGECYRCPKYPNCDEAALVYEVKVK